MKICISSQGKTLDSEIDPRFGRSQYLVIVDTETNEFVAIKNPASDATGGAGIQTAQIVSEKGVEAVLTGNIGPNAFQTLEAAGIKVFTGFSGKLIDAIEKYKKGNLQETKSPTAKHKSGFQKGV